MELGDSARAVAVTAGGDSGDTKSKHFNDQAQRYATGNLRTFTATSHSSRGIRSGSIIPGNESCCCPPVFACAS
ncbi:MAG: penicillin acylase family protein [Gemmatimonas sp.]